jgi:S1-C subfamily serine protease
MKPSCVRISLIANLVGFLLTTAAISQKTGTNPAASGAGVQVADGHIPDLLHQFDKSLQTLAAKVSPAVVRLPLPRLGRRTRRGRMGPR